MHKSPAFLKHPADSAWFFVPKRRPAARLRLFCFAYAGGSAHVFRSWPDYLNTAIEVCAIQLPGRGARFKEPLLDSMDLILNELEAAIEPYVEQGLSLPYAFFGHSMGASIAFELCRRIQAKKLPLPQQLIVSGRRAPQLPLEDGRVMIHQLPKLEFIERLRKLNGTPDELLQHDDLMNLMEPVLRCDFKVIETWRYHTGQKLKLPVSVFSGQNDEHLDEQALAAWQEQSVFPCEFYRFPGDHFYLHTSEQILLAKLDQVLQDSL